MAALQRLIALALLAPLAGCLPAARGTASRTCAPIEQECRVRIANYSSYDVVVYYGGAAGRELLSSVPSGGATAVAIADPFVSGTVSLWAENESGGGRTVCSRRVKLSEEGVADFVIMDRCNPRRDTYPPPRRDAPAEQPTDSRIPSSGEDPSSPPPGDVG